MLYLNKLIKDTEESRQGFGLQQTLVNSSPLSSNITEMCVSPEDANVNIFCDSNLEIQSSVMECAYKNKYIGKKKR